MNYGKLDLNEEEYPLEPEKEINLSRGDLNFNTPLHIIDAANQAMRRGFTHYSYRYGDLSYHSPQLGLPDLRNAISTYYQKYGTSYNQDEILVTSGSASALYLIFNRYLAKGDEVIVTDPTYPGYFKILNKMGVKIHKLPLERINKWEINIDELNDKISRKTKMVILCNPLNPSGKVMREDELKGITDIVQEKELMVLSDEIYNEYIWGSLKHKAISAIDDMKNRTFVVQSFSKTFSMTGWRLGYVMSSSSKIKELSQVPTGYIPSTFIQKAGSLALRELTSNDRWGPSTFLEMWRREIQRRLHFLYKILSDIDGVKCSLPDATYYLWPDFSDLDLRTQDVVTLLQRKNVSVDPGTKYGDLCEGHVRIGMVQPFHYLEEAANRIQEIFKDRL